MSSNTGLPIEPVKHKKVYETVALQLRKLIEQGTLQPGEKLPGERELARHFSVSRASIRQAIAVLRAAGMLQIKPGDGIYVSEKACDRVLAHSLASELSELFSHTHEVLECRRVLERELAGLAAKRAKESQVSELKASLDRLAVDVSRHKYSLEEDRRFHSLVAAAAGNRLLERFYRHIMRRLERETLYTLKDPCEGNRPQRYLDQHKRIVRSIEKGDEVAARAHMDEHVRDIINDVMQDSHASENRGHLTTT